MTHKEAQDMADRMNANSTGTNGKLEPVSAAVVRILPNHVDPVVEGDNGWDVEVTVL